jgi:hypothetical protein
MSEPKRRGVRGAPRAGTGRVLNRTIAILPNYKLSESPAQIQLRGLWCFERGTA